MRGVGPGEAGVRVMTRRRLVCVLAVVAAVVSPRLAGAGEVAGATSGSYHSGEIVLAARGGAGGAHGRMGAPGRFGSPARFGRPAFHPFPARHFPHRFPFRPFFGFGFGFVGPWYDPYYPYYYPYYYYPYNPY